VTAADRPAARRGEKPEWWDAFVQSIGEASDLRPIVAEGVERRAEIFSADARDMIRNGENRGDSLMVERGEDLASVVLAARWWLATWQVLAVADDAHRLVVSGAYAHCACGVEFSFPTHAQQYGDHRAAVATGGPVGPVGSGPTPIEPVAGQEAGT
jgi:hypothetical protein